MGVHHRLSAAIPAGRAVRLAGRGGAGRPACSGRLAAAMLDALVRPGAHRVNNGGPLTVEATVSPGNASSRAFFGAFARRHGVALTEHPHFTAAQLDPGGVHEDEPLRENRAPARPDSGPELPNQFLYDSPHLHLKTLGGQYFAA